MAFSGVLVDQFVVFYYKSDNRRSKRDSLYVAMFLLSILYGIVFYLLLTNSLDLIKYLFFSQFDGYIENSIFQFLKILFFEMAFWPLYILNQKMLNSKAYYSVSYALNLIPSLAFLIGLSLYYFGQISLEEALIIKVVGVSFASVVSSIFIFNFFNISFYDGLDIENKLIKDLIKSSFMMKLGHNIHNFLVIPVFTGYLSSFGTGVISSFYYAYKSVVILHSIVVGPQVAVCQTEFSKFYSVKNILGIEKVSRNYYKFSLFFYIFLWLVGYALVPIIFELIGVGFNYALFLGFYAFLGFWYFLITVESVSVLLAVTANRYIYFIGVNLLFIGSFYLITNFLSSYLNLYAVFVAVCLAQFFSLCLYFIMALKIKKEMTL